MSNTLPQNTPQKQGRTENYGKVKDRIEAMLHQGLPYSEITRQLHCSVGTVSYHAQRLGLRNADLEKSGHRYDWKAIQHYHDEGHNAIECAQKFGFSLSAWSSAVKAGRVVTDDARLPIGKMLVLGSGVRTSYLRQRLLQESLLENVCNICGICEWNGKPLSLHLDHINGNHADNRIENLRLLCPNCHTQTETYGAKNRKTYLSKQEHEANNFYRCCQCSKREGKDILKPREDFYKSNSARHGLASRCKMCADEISRQRKQKAKVA